MGLTDWPEQHIPKIVAEQVGERLAALCRFCASTLEKGDRYCMGCGRRIFSDPVPEGYFRCGSCGELIDIGRIVLVPVDLDKHCPHCGQIVRRAERRYRSGSAPLREGLSKVEAELAARARGRRVQRAKDVSDARNASDLPMI